MGIPTSAEADAHGNHVLDQTRAPQGPHYAQSPDVGAGRQVIAGQYQVIEYLGSAAFSKAVQCIDLRDGSHVCIKIIK